MVYTHIDFNKSRSINV